MMITRDHVRISDGRIMIRRLYDLPAMIRPRSQDKFCKFAEERSLKKK